MASVSIVHSLIILRSQNIRESQQMSIQRGVDLHDLDINGPGPKSSPIVKRRKEPPVPPTKKEVPQPPPKVRTQNEIRNLTDQILL